MRKDKVAFIKFGLERGHKRADIAEALGMTEKYLNVYIKRYCKETK